MAKLFPAEKFTFIEVALAIETSGVPTAPANVVEDAADTAALKVVAEVNVAVPEDTSSTNRAVE